MRLRILFYRDGSGCSLCEPFKCAFPVANCDYRPIVFSVVCHSRTACGIIYWALDVWNL